MAVFQIIKLGKRLHITIGAFVFFLICWPSAEAQQLKTSNYGVKYLGTEKAYKQSLTKDELKKMFELKHLIPAVVYDLRYATAANFVKQAVYSVGTNYTFQHFAS